MNRNLLLCLFLLSILLPWGGEAKAQIELITVTLGEEITITEMNWHDTSFENDPNNPLPWPGEREATSQGNTAHVSLSASPGEAGVVQAWVGIEFEWDLGQYAWDEINKLPLEVTVDFTYEIGANWVEGNGSSNAGVSVHPLVAIEPPGGPVPTEWYDFIGRVTGEAGNRNNSITKTYEMTIGELGNSVRFQVYSQAHLSPNGSGTHDSYADVTVNSITIKPAPCTEVKTVATNERDSLLSCILGLTSGDIITFDTSIFPLNNPATIALTNALPAITVDNVTIDGSNAGVILDGSGTPGGTNGLVINGASNVVIKGLQILNFPGSGIHLTNGASNNTIGGRNGSPGGTCTDDCNLISSNGDRGIVIESIGATGNTVSGNYIGTDVNGTAGQGNTWMGVDIRGGAQANTVGGRTADERNIISSNGFVGVGIWDTGTDNNIVIGNYIGTNVNGTSELGNDDGGVRLGHGPEHNIVGGATSEERNIISGNGRDGVEIGGSHNNLIIGNYIGTDVNGVAALGNAERGIGINGAGQNMATTLNVIERNLISGNNWNGLDIWGPNTEGNIVKNNYIGTNAAGDGALPNALRGIAVGGGAQSNIIGPGNIIAFNGYTGVGVGFMQSDTIKNRITQNSIHSNVFKGIELLDGGNLELSPPTLTKIGANTVNGLAPPFSTVEIFSDEEDEGRYFHGSAVADASGNFAFTQASDFTGANVTATATDGDGNTSEFSDAEIPSFPTTIYLYLPIIVK